MISQNLSLKLVTPKNIRLIAFKIAFKIAWSIKKSQ